MTRKIGIRAIVLSHTQQLMCTIAVTRCPPSRERNEQQSEKRQALEGSGGAEDEVEGELSRKSIKDHRACQVTAGCFMFKCVVW